MNDQKFAQQTEYMMSKATGYHVDFQFRYQLPVIDEDEDSDTSIVTFSTYIGHDLEEAVERYRFIWRHNIHTPGMIHIRLRFEPNGAVRRGPIILSRRTPQGEGDW